MPVAAAVIGVAGTAYAASQSNKAVDKSVAAQTNATNQQIALQKDIYGNTVAANTPFTNAGYTGLEALMAQLGLSSGTGQSAAQPANDGNPYDQYEAANPDLAQEAARVVGSDPRFPTKEAYYQWHDQKYANEGRGSFVDGPTTGAPEAPATTGAPTTYGPDLSSLGSRQTYTRPAQAPLPGAPNLSASRYQTSPGYQWQMKEGNRAINALSAARGLGQSSGAIKSALNYSQGLADQDYQQWVGNELSIWQMSLNQAVAQNNLQNQTFESDRNYGTGVYDADRNYLTNQYNTQTGNLQWLTSLGQSAANNTANAGQTYAANTGNALQTNANALSAGYNQTAANNSTAWNNIAGIGQNLITSYNGGNQIQPGSNALTSAYQPVSGIVAPQTGTLTRAPYVQF